MSRRPAAVVEQPEVDDVQRLLGELAALDAPKQHEAEAAARAEAEAAEARRSRLGPLARTLHDQIRAAIAGPAAWLDRARPGQAAKRVEFGYNQMHLMVIDNAVVQHRRALTAVAEDIAELERFMEELTQPLSLERLRVIEARLQVHAAGLARVARAVVTLRELRHKVRDTLRPIATAYADDVAWADEEV